MSEAVEPAATVHKSPGAFYSWLIPPSDLRFEKVSVYEFVRSDLLEFHRALFASAGLEHPTGWDDISDIHIDLMKNHNIKLFQDMEVVSKRQLPISTRRPRPEGWPGTTLYLHSESLIKFSNCTFEES
jgi:hypothetical protein